MSDPTPPTAALERLATQVAHAGLQTPAQMLLDLLAPIDIISSHLALFCRPLLGGTSWELYATALSESSGWQELRRLLAR